jgi:hypothetical protein
MEATTMGGPGSGRRLYRKAVVEDCLQLDANRWMRQGLRDRVRMAGTWRWIYPGGRSFSVDYELDTREPDEAFAQLWYGWVWTPTGEPDWVDYRVDLTATWPHLGGLRWWFVCPLLVGGVACRRRVGKLYLPPRARYFGCRHCHRLTYTSCQEHDKRVDALRRNPEALAAILDNPEGASFQALCLAIKADL